LLRARVIFLKYALEPAKFSGEGGGVQLRR
jgi:hypothetical protein